MSVYAAPDAAMGPPPPGLAGPPPPGDPNSMAMLAAALGQGAGAGAGGPDVGGPPPDLGAPTPGGPPGTGDANTDLLAGMSSTDHIRAAIKHLMMAMTESQDDQESHGITKGMAALHGILAGKAKANATVTAAGGTPAGG